jgi:uncharacterized membrane protein YedE/YeeE
MHNFTPLPALLGGALIGLAATLILVFEGKVAGISGIVAGFMRPAPADTAWRGQFLGGLLVGGVLLRLVYPQAFGPTSASLASVAVAGLLVGYGTRLGNGCTSGHGVCGNSRLSIRSMIATVTFILTGAVTVFVVRKLLGGAA